MALPVASDLATLKFFDDGVFGAYGPSITDRTKLDIFDNNGLVWPQGGTDGGPVEPPIPPGGGVVPADALTRIIMPVMTRSWQEHFVDEGWTTPQQQIDAGYPLYIQPADDTGMAVWEMDYVNPLPPLRISFQLTLEEIAPACTATVQLECKGDLPGDIYVIVPGDPLAAPVALVADTRYIRATLQITTSGDREGLVYVHAWGFVIDTTYMSETGVVTVPAGGSVHVDLTSTFVDVRSVQLTPGSAGIAYVRYLVDLDQQGFTVYATDNLGNPVGGEVSWTVIGF